MVAMKPTRFMSNSQAMLDQSSNTCDKTHTHKPLHGKYSEETAYYPLGLINSSLQGMKLQAAEDTPNQDEARARKRPVQQLICAAKPQSAKMPISKTLGKCKMSCTDGKLATESVYDPVNVKQTYLN